MLQVNRQEGVLEHRAKWSQGTASARSREQNEQTRKEQKENEAGNAESRNSVLERWDGKKLIRGHKG